MWFFYNIFKETSLIQLNLVQNLLKSFNVTLRYPKDNVIGLPGLFQGTESETQDCEPRIKFLASLFVWKK